MNKKIVPLVMIVIGMALLIASLIFSLETVTATEPAGLGQWIFNVLGLFLGAGTGIKGWLDLRKARAGASGSKDQRTQDAIDSPDSEQTMEDKGGIQKQKTTNSPRSKQAMK